MNAIEEAGKVAGTFMDALKREPLSLALVVMNLALLVFFYVILLAVAAQREREISLLYDDKRRVEDMLSKCVIPKLGLPDEPHAKWVCSPESPSH